MNLRRLSVAALVFAGAGATGLATSSSASAATLPAAPGAPAASFDVGTLHVDRYGSGADAVVLVPGLGCGPWVWFGAIPHLVASHRVYVVTLPGFAGRPAQTAVAGQVFATTERDLEGVMDREHLKAPVLVGHSLGGSIAIGFGERYPARARAIVSVDALPVQLALAYQPSDERKKQADSAAVSFGALASPEQTRAYQMQNVATTGALDAGQFDQILTHELESDRATVTADLREDLETDLRPALPKLTAPLLVVVPYDLADNSTPPAVQPPIVFQQSQKVAAYRALLAGAPHATLVPIAPARHFVMIDAPQAFQTALDAFLAQHPPAST